jgi:hypothetical protein
MPSPQPTAARPYVHDRLKSIAGFMRLDYDAWNQPDDTTEIDAGKWQRLADDTAVLAASLRDLSDYAERQSLAAHQRQEASRG